jgi:hypothetical protein
MMSETKTAKATRKPLAKKADKTQFERFVETARKIGVDESPEALDRAFEKIAPSKPPP